MKSTKSSRKRNNSRYSRQQTLNRLYIGVITVIIILTATLFGIKLSQRSTLDISREFSRETMLYGKEGLEGNMQRADGFSANLCVGAGNIPLDGIAVDSNEKAALFYLDKKQVLFAQNMNDRIFPASITKIMTAILAVKYGNMDDEVIISENACKLESGAQVCGFKPGDRTTMDELFHALLVYSGNDAAVAIAEHISGTVEEFVALMNAEARSLGASSTHFVNPHGLHDENHYTTVYDIYLMLNEALTHEQFVDAMQMSVYNLSYYRADGTRQQLRLDATDLYLTHQKTAPQGVTVLGGKTGTTDEAGSCLAIASQNSYGEPFISIIVNAPNKSVLYEDMNQLLSKINT